MIFSTLLYYLVLIPISLLPFPVLHIISRFIYVILYHLVGYRKKVVLENLKNSFPDKSEEERTFIAKQFYKHLCDVFLEGQKIFTISKKQLARHMKCSNPEIVNQYSDQGKSVVLAVGHYNSWELMLTGMNTFFDHRAVVIYQPLRNKFFNQKMIRARSMQGTVMLPVKEVKSFFNTPSEELSATVFAIDQSPSNPEKSYWMPFLNQDTAVLYGTEYYAKNYNLPVIYAHLQKLKRGYYTLTFIEVTNKPNETAYGEITEKVTHLLEQDIITQPEFWLWSHRRWKHKRPGSKN